MRFIGILLALAILVYVIKIYMDSSVVTSDDGEETYTSRPQETIEQVEETTNQLNQMLQNQQKKLREVD